MQKSKTLVAQALTAISDNMARTGDPLGFKSVYWTDWAGGLGLSKKESTVLLTGRMYQMLPYVVQATEMVAAANLLLPLLSVRAFSKMAQMAGATIAEPLLRLKARRSRIIRDRGERALRGIAGALNKAGLHPGFLYDKEPYSGTLLYDLGLEEHIGPHARKVCRDLKSLGVKSVITTDPHTTFMLKTVFHEYIFNHQLQVRHYLECLSAINDLPFERIGRKMPKTLVMHDSCVMTRNLGIIDQARNVAARIGITLMEAKNTKEDTACCGGPVEYAYPELSRRISCIRIRELAGICKDILVTCPICLINLMKYEQKMRIRVWDMGELLYYSTMQNDMNLPKSSDRKHCKQL